MRATASSPGSVTIAMPDGQPYIIKTLLSAANHKQKKGADYHSVGLILTPRATGHAGRNLCPSGRCARSDYRLGRNAKTVTSNRKGVSFADVRGR